MDKDILRQLLKNLQIIMRCPHCGKPYNLDEIHLRGFTANTYMLKMECSNCHLPVQASITVNENLNQSRLNPILPQMPQVRFDGFKKITPPNTYKKPLKIQKPISADEVIDFHRFIKDFNGKFNQI